jgi:outer membrane protein assembly factor BamB
MKAIFGIVIIIGLTSLCDAQIQNQEWPQFRGINGSGVASETSKPPVVLDNTTLMWRTNLAGGVSSPVIWQEKLFITGFNKSSKELLTICIDSKNGKTLWSKVAVPDSLEKYHSISSPAAGSVTTDGERVISYFGSCGLFCYTNNGKLLWKYSITPDNYTYGSGTSPVLAGDKLILIRDFGSKPYITALNKKTGAVLWKTNFSTPSMGIGGHATPLISDNVIILHRLFAITGISAIDGTELWNYPVMSTGCTTPILSDNKIIIACWQNLGEEEQRGKLPDFNKLVKDFDENKNGTVSQSELPDNLIFYTRPELSDKEGASGSVKKFFGMFDHDQDKEINNQDWDASLKLLKDTWYKPTRLIALNLKNKERITEKDTLWKVEGNVPEVPSPICYKNRVYMVKDGGILTCVDTESGKVIYTTRIGNSGPYIASPVAANGFLYLFGYNGKGKILKAGDKFELAGSFDIRIIRHTCYNWEFDLCQNR